MPQPRSTFSTSAIDRSSYPRRSRPDRTLVHLRGRRGQSSGGQGCADVWKKGYFAWEYKGKHANLDKAYQQFLQYREALENPPLLIVSDTDQIIIHTNFTNTVKRIFTITLDDLLMPDSLALLRDAFYIPDDLRAGDAGQVTQEAAAHSRDWPNSCAITATTRRRSPTS